jgi:3',5'-cyclic AMP phosphodiesterase CpdA
MPIHLPPLSRRRFLAGSLAAGAGLFVHRFAGGEEAGGVDPDRIVLLSDTHIAADPMKVNLGTNVTDNLKRVVAQVVGLRPRPAAVFVNGDCAFGTGEAGDYAQFVKLIAPLREAGLHVYLGLGNHDNRERFWAGVGPQEKRAKEIEDRQITVVETPRANWLMLDSLDQTNKTPGVLGAQQLKWLAAALDARADRPAVVVVHHQPDYGDKVSGLTDTRALMDVLAPRKQVKALIYGHTHNWARADREGIHGINLPPTAYPFQKTRPSGWVDVRLADAGATFSLNALDEKHPEHGQTLDLTWRG